MATLYPSLGTDLLAAFVELARQGSLRRAAAVLHITEQGLRTRLLTLEERLQVELYRKSRGMRRTTQLTEAGRRFLPHAVAFLERARELCDLAAGTAPGGEVHVAASQYLILYLLIDAVKEFRRAHPDIHVRLSTRLEQEIEQDLLQDSVLSLGVAAPYEAEPGLEYTHLFELPWSLITPLRHSLLREKGVRLQRLAGEPLILFERGSTGRQHVMEAFQRQGLAPQVVMEAAHTEIIMRMVEAGLGLSLVPLMPSGKVTRGRRVGIRSLNAAIRPIRSGILARRGERLSAAAQKFKEFITGVGRRTA